MCVLFFFFVTRRRHTRCALVTGMQTCSLPISMSDEPIELERYVRPGDTIWLNQGTAEPLSLTESLGRQRAAVGPCRAFLGLNSSTTLQAEHADYLSLQIGRASCTERLCH